MPTNSQPFTTSFSGDIDSRYLNKANRAALNNLPAGLSRYVTSYAFDLKSTWDCPFMSDDDFVSIVLSDAAALSDLTVQMNNDSQATWDLFCDKRKNPDFYD